MRRVSTRVVGTVEVYILLTTSMMLSERFVHAGTISIRCRKRKGDVFVYVRCNEIVPAAKWLPARGKVQITLG